MNAARGPSSLAVWPMSFRGDRTVIFQCHFLPEQRAECFPHEPYRPINLTELVPDPYDEAQLSEYAAMMHLHDHPELNPDPWIGFTSFRQLRKTTHVFRTKAEVEALLAKADVVAWGLYQFVHYGTGLPVTYLEQSEILYPGMTRTLIEMMFSKGLGLPDSYVKESAAASCLYFALSNASFREWMEWSRPLVTWHLEFCRMNRATEKPRIVAYTHERLVSLWLGHARKSVIVVGKVNAIAFDGAMNPRWGEAKPNGQGEWAFEPDR